MKPEIRDRYNREKRQYQIWAASFQAKLRRALPANKQNAYLKDWTV